LEKLFGDHLHLGIVGVGLVNGQYTGIAGFREERFASRIETAKNLLVAFIVSFVGERYSLATCVSENEGIVGWGYSHRDTIWNFFVEKMQMVDFVDSLYHLCDDISSRSDLFLEQL
jgi:hypothetical protein